MAKDLTHNQQRFADEYIISGNTTEAYKRVYKNVTKDTTANSNSSRLLRNAKVSNYIQECNNSIQSDKIATMEEVREFWTDSLSSAGYWTAEMNRRLTELEEVLSVIMLAS